MSFFKERLRKNKSFPTENKKFATKDRTRIQVLIRTSHHYTTTPTQQKLEEIYLYKYNLESFCNRGTGYFPNSLSYRKIKTHLKHGANVLFERSRKSAFFESSRNLFGSSFGPVFCVFILTLWEACLHGGGAPQVGEVTCGGGSTHRSCKRDQLRWEIIWTGGLPDLPGVPYLHVNWATKFVCIRRMINVS